MSANTKVVGIDAVPVIASVQHEHALGYFLVVVKGPPKTMSLEHAPMRAENAISPRIDTPQP
jgi:hypothetical protein